MGNFPELPLLPAALPVSERAGGLCAPARRPTVPTVPLTLGDAPAALVGDEGSA